MSRFEKDPSQMSRNKTNKKHSIIEMLTLLGVLGRGFISAAERSRCSGTHKDAQNMAARAGTQ